MPTSGFLNLPLVSYATMRTFEFVPTSRELVLLTALLFSLLYLTHNRQSSYFASWDPTSTDVSSLKTNSAASGVIRYPEPRLSWTKAETKIIAHVPGWTILDNLFLMNGTLLVVTSSPQEIPDLRLLTSSGYPIFNGPIERAKRIPSDSDIRIISPDEAQRLFRTNSVSRFDGVNFMNTDPKQFITHYYHWAAEMLFGIWRTYSSLDPFISADGHTTLPPPKRMFFRHINSGQWRDYASMNQWVTRGAFPSISMEFIDDWAFRAEMGMPFVFDRVVLADRASAGEGDPFKATWRTASNAFDLRGSAHWWAPIRKSVLEFSGLPEQWMTGADPSALADNQKFVITYISRQSWGRRMLRQVDHEKLVEELYKLRDRYGYEVNVVSMDKLTRAEQFQLAGRTTIMMGVHGNGLTSLLWMRPTARSTVIEFFYPQGLAFDYEYTTRALGMVHYGVWDNVTFTRPNVPQFPNYPEGFQGNDIPVNGAVVARLVHTRLMLDTDSN